MCVERDCQNASESASLPHGVCGRKMKKETFSSKVEIEPHSKPLLGFQVAEDLEKSKSDHLSHFHCSSYIPWLPNMCVERDCQNASESAALPHGVCGRKN